MKSDQVKIAEIHEREKLYDTFKEIATNPVVMSVIGLAVIEYLQGHDEVVSGTPGFTRHVAGGGWMGSAAGTAMEVGIMGYLIGPNVIATAESIKPMINTMKDLAPLLLAMPK